MSRLMKAAVRSELTAEVSGEETAKTFATGVTKLLMGSWNDQCPQ